jgi:S-adenosylmethionine decarboxylase
MATPYLSLVGGQKPPVGKHLLVRLTNMNANDLETKESARKSLWEIANECKLTVVAENGFQFTPVGSTYVLVLAESHISIHTYPERHEAYLDMFCCNMTFDEKNALDVIQRVYQGAQVDIFTVIR